MPKQANNKAAHTDCNTHHYLLITFILYTMHLCVQFNDFNHALWVAVKCEASGVSEDTPTVAEASEASKATSKVLTIMAYSGYIHHGVSMSSWELIRGVNPLSTIRYS